jgi:hypothetical protein
MLTCVDVSVSAQAQKSDKVPSWPPVLSSERPEGIPDNVPWPPPLDKLPPPPPNVMRPLPSQAPPAQLTPPSTPSEPPATPKFPPIAGLPLQEALAILKRHGEELINLPGADGVALDSDGILVYTDNPAIVPAQVEGLPVKTQPALGWKNAEVPPGPPPFVPEQQCEPPSFFDPKAGHCV